jgi:cell division protein FtsI/penicillin-binding protein 2
MTLAFKFVVVCVIFFVFFMILLLRYAVEEIRVGDIFEDAQNNKNPFDENKIMCARITEVRYDENGKKWVKFDLYERGELDKTEQTMDAVTFLSRYIRV